GPAALSSNPVNVPRGQTLSVQLIGRGTSWREGVTSVEFSGIGIEVLSVTVQSATVLNALVHVSPSAPLGFQGVIVRSQVGTSEEIAEGHTILRVVAPIAVPTLLSVEPNTLSRGAASTILVRGALTAWTEASTVTFGPGIT